MEPLRIECRLAGPWSPPHGGTHLDGLLAWAIKEEALDNSAPDTKVDYDTLIADLPLERFECDDGWCWKASLFQPVGFMGQERRYLTAKTPVMNMALAIGSRIVQEKGGASIDTVRGLGKNAALYYTLEHVHGLQAWCLGDAEAIIHLLEQVQAIGVKTRLGHGSLLPYGNGQLFQITHDPDAHEKWKHRNAPQKLTEAMYPGVGSFKPPYWKHKDYCWIPMPC